MRLVRSSDFARLREKGRKVSGGLIYMVRAAGDGPDAGGEGGGGPRLGLSVSARVGGAVERNRIRRRLREIFRTNAHRFAPGAWYLIGAKRGAAEAGFDRLRAEVLALAGRLAGDGETPARP